jgi:hypothetical protein
MQPHLSVARKLLHRTDMTGERTTSFRLLDAGPAAPGIPANAAPAPARPASEPWTRFQELVAAAVDLFNKGTLSQASLLLELAERWQREHAFDAADVELVRTRLGQALTTERLARYAAKPEDRLPLRVVLEFFPAFSPEALLAELKPEPKRDRRRWLLLLLEAHGEPARLAALAHLKQALGRTPDSEEWYFQRNLLHLLRRIPRSGEIPLVEEAELAVRHCRLGLPSLVIKEAIGLLGQTRDDRAEQALLRLLSELADMVPGRDSFSETRDLSAVADRVAAALASFPTHRARSAIVNYAERVHMETGRPMTALAALGRHDLSTDEPIVDRLIGIIRRGRPSGFTRRLLALKTDQAHDDMTPAIEALSDTPLPLVRRTFEKIVREYPAKSSGRLAARALAGFARRERGRQRAR